VKPEGLLRFHKSPRPTSMLMHVDQSHIPVSFYFVSILTLSTHACLDMAGDLVLRLNFGVVRSSVFHAAVFWNVTPCCSLIETLPKMRTYVIHPVIHFGVVRSSVFHAAVFWNVTPRSLVETLPTLRTYVIHPSFTHLRPTGSYSS
jgi:hypothetical protein